MTRSSPNWSRLRLRRTAHLRDLVAETTFSVAQLIQPLFVVEGLEGSEPIDGLGDNARLGRAAALDRIARDVEAAVRPSIMSLGATPSAPASAAATAMPARASSVASRSMPCASSSTAQ